MIAAEAGGITGHITSLGHEPHHYTIFDVDVDDVGAYLEKARSLGGKMLVPPVEIPTGTFAWMQDPEGNTVGCGRRRSELASSGGNPLINTFHSGGAVGDFEGLLVMTSDARERATKRRPSETEN